MSKIKTLVFIGLTWLSQLSYAITNAELARLNNELIGLDARLAVAKKQAELSKYNESVQTPRSASVSENRAATAYLPETDKLSAPSKTSTGKAKLDSHLPVNATNRSAR